MNKMILSLILILVTTTPVAAMDSSSSHGAHGKQTATDHGAASEAVFEHKETVEGIRAEFQVMSLASMNMTDPADNTHHIMVKLIDETSNRPLEKVVGKIKVIGPDGKEQEGVLKDYGEIKAANFSFTQKGKYGVICLFKVEEKKRLVKFWYEKG